VDAGDLSSYIARQCITQEDSYNSGGEEITGQVLGNVTGWSAVV